MSKRNLLFHAILDNSVDDSRRMMLRDELIGSGCWDWPTVLGYVLDYPDADGPRLLAADWLEDDSQWDRAEFIRTQCRIGRLLDVLGADAPSRPDVAALLRTERELAEGLSDLLTEDLIDPRDASWSGARGDDLRVRGGGVALDYARGFASRIEIDTETFLDRAGDLFSSQPIAAVRLTDKTPVKVAEGWWWGDTCLAPSDPRSRARYVPPELYVLLGRGPRVGGRHRPSIAPAELTYPTAATARAALSSACVALGRSLAGLAYAPDLHYRVR